jgi:beta-N-acetylhexosaminidase
MMRAAIVGIGGPALDPAEAALFRGLPPAGVILFARNVQDPLQLRRLTDALRAALPPGAVVAVDQEGGRVARLRPPHWLPHPAAGRIGTLHARDADAGLRAAWLTGALIGAECAAGGIGLVCAPVLDLRVPGAHDVVGDRSYGADPGAVAQLGRAVAHGLLAAGVQPVAKHAPGHGRALVDSHLALPSVPADQDLAHDLQPFAANADLPWMMTAHLLYPGLDAALPGTLSPVVIEQVIRGRIGRGQIGRGRIGFGGVLVSDDLAMRALDGTPAALAAQAVAAGCDLALHCTGVLADTEAVLDGVPPASEAALARMAAGLAQANAARRPLDLAALAAERGRLLP